MRLIDGEELYDIEKLLDTYIIQNSKEAAYLMPQVLYDIEAMPTIDPEMLPIVQELREQLAQVTAERDALKSNPPVEIESDAFELATRLAEMAAERDAAIDFAGRLLVICTPPKEWEPKLFRKIIRGIGDYMGTGYAFLDAFYKEYDDFQESDSTGVLREILSVAECKRKSKQEGQDDE